MYENEALTNTAAPRLFAGKRADDPFRAADAILTERHL